MVKNNRLMSKNVENVIIRHLPEKQGKVFEKCYNLPYFILVTTTGCPRDIEDKFVETLDSKGLSWVAPLKTGTSRELFVGSLDCYYPNEVILKKSRFNYATANSSSFLPAPIGNEIRTNYILNFVLKRMEESGELVSGADFDSVEARVERPVGIVVDKLNKLKYSVFFFERGFDSGEVLKCVEPPIQGAYNYNPSDWKTFYEIKDILDRVNKTALSEGLIMQDYDIHQVLYRLGEGGRSIKLLLIDSERFKMRD